MHSFPFLEGVTNMKLFVPEQCADAITAGPFTCAPGRKKT